MNCKYCGTPLPDGAVFCVNCGMENTPEPTKNNFGTDGIYCSNCGTEIFPGDAFCPECGMAVNGNSSTGPSTQSFKEYGDRVTYDNSGINGYNNTSNGYINGYKNYNDTYKMPPPKSGSKTALIIIIAAAVVVAAAAGIVIWKWNDIFDRPKIADESAATETVPTEAVTDPSNGDYALNDGESEDAPPAAAEPESEYFYDSADRYITYSDLDRYSKDEVRLILNEMYARHGYIFSTDEIRQYFESKSWYHGNTESQDVALSRFNDIEKSNRQTIMEYEHAHGWR